VITRGMVPASRRRAPGPCAQQARRQGRGVPPISAAQTAATWATFCGEVMLAVAALGGLLLLFPLPVVQISAH
jgi:hypothetical protein